MYDLNDAITAWASSRLVRLTEEDFDDRLDRATHAATRILSGAPTIEVQSRSFDIANEDCSEVMLITLTDEGLVLDRFVDDIHRFTLAVTTDELAALIDDLWLPGDDPYDGDD
jgi:hypothetical protein